MTISQLSPNVPGHKGLHSNPWAVPYEGYMHIITASHNSETNVLYVHIGCPVLLTDTVNDGESVWDAIRRVVFAWQAEELEQDHAEALEINAHMGVCNECGQTPCVCDYNAVITDESLNDWDNFDGYYGCDSDDPSCDCIFCLPGV